MPPLLHHHDEHLIKNGLISLEKILNIINDRLGVTKETSITNTTPPFDITVRDPKLSVVITKLKAGERPILHNLSIQIPESKSATAYVKAIQNVRSFGTAHTMWVKFHIGKLVYHFKQLNPDDSIATIAMKLAGSGYNVQALKKAKIVHEFVSQIPVLLDTNFTKMTVHYLVNNQGPIRRHLASLSQEKKEWLRLLKTEEVFKLKPNTNTTTKIENTIEAQEQVKDYDGINWISSYESNVKKM